MAATDSLAQFIDIAQSACDDAARRLGNAQRLVTQAETKRDLLAGYWSDYQARQRSIYLADATRMANFHDFLAKLKSTIDAHEADMAMARAGLDEARRDWELAQRRLKSLENLSGRRRAQAKTMLDRAQQKLQDEISTQRLMRGMTQAG